MLPTSEQLALLSASLLGVMSAIYCRGIWRGDTRPHPFTWGVWSAIGVTGLASNLAAGGGSVVIMLAVVTITQASIFFLSLKRPPEDIPVHWSAWAICLGGLVLWLVAHQPLYAAIGVVLADGVAAWPTIQNAWRNPDCEPPAIWLIDGLALAIGVLSVETFSLAALLYPVYLAIGCMTIGVVALARGRRLRG